ncbi:Uncharacterized protein FWK35_00037251 [Aphis craccivora]|uniref:PHD-type domain-containing protein n=1 Tax=Aphis craccivora TaxID=307492 RepID=A0A6G0VVS4_APHCR|nr:Uncharacterized protein FWK35_00037251 [Aphis craccivora]
MVRPNCELCSEPVQREQPSISCHSCKNLFHSNCVNPLSQNVSSPSNNPSWICKVCLIKPKPSDTDDKLNRILSELQSIKSHQLKSDDLLNGISSSMAALNDKVLQQGKYISSLGQSVTSLGKQLSTVTIDVKSHGQLIASPTTTEFTPSLNDIAREVQLRSLLAVNLIIRGVPESPNKSISERISHDKKFVSDIFSKLDPPVPVELILKAYRIGKTSDTKPRLLKIILTSREAVDSIVTTFPKLLINPPDHLRSVSITRDRTQSERQSIREVYQELSTRRERGESNISIRYYNGIPKIITATSDSKNGNHQQRPTTKKS